MKAHLAVAVATLGLMSTAYSPARAQPDYPSRPIRMIVPFAAGGPTDVLSRQFAKALTDELKQNVIIDNKPGAGGNIGVDIVAKAPADGYTIGFATNGPLAVNVTLFGKLPYDPTKDLTPISRFALVPNVLVVHPSMGVKDFDSMMKLLRANPGKYIFASGGNGTTQHLSVEMLKVMGKVEIGHVPYKGEGPAITDVLGGQVPALFSSVAVGLPYVKSGKLIPIAVTSRERVRSLPSVPTIAEKGIPGFDVSAWYGVFAPPGLPADILKKLNAASRRAIQSPALQEWLVSMGGTPSPSTPEEFGAFIKSEILRWKPIIEASGAKVD
ncbi:Bug family tripartite tricarboxylate transporter substrate binding protein [Cupriavidus metallidurans]|uniref:Bug family tripartite tricarboxylate transporter substrate binding protein n=1 Tax=Cupriavidus metallidurans TaxID=119219 RepID=UPI000560EE01|nr:tripartite tricarboxylate transporter substrate binding protein [Cupriavidus metallidurans]